MNENDKQTSQNTEDGLIRHLLEHGLIDKVELDECVQYQKTAGEGGDQTSVAGLLVARGYLTTKQVERVKASLEGDKPTRQIPGFQILERIGAGAMATVVKAKQLSLDRTVAIKILPKHLSRDEEFVDRFYKEGKAAAKLNHNNIVQAIDVGESGGYHYFVMEYVEGLSIYEEMAGGKRYTEERALDILIQVAQALDHANERGLIHRDVKPKNVIVTPDGVVKLADLGLARTIGDMRAADSEAGRAYGTPYYIAPEQIRGERDIDARIDIYSLGATAYHMLTGRVPFEGPNPSAIMHKHLKQELVPPDHINPKISAGMAEVIEMMMAKNRDDRYKTAKDVLVDLRCIAKGEAPLLARKRIDDQILKNLAEESSVAGQRIQEGPIPTGAAIQVKPKAKVKSKPKPQSGTKSAKPAGPKTPVLAVVLIISIIINIVLVAIVAIMAGGK